MAVAGMIHKSSLEIATNENMKTWIKGYKTYLWHLLFSPLGRKTFPFMRNNEKDYTSVIKTSQRQRHRYFYVEQY
jgi:tryptophan synthase beta subunit